MNTSVEKQASWMLGALCRLIFFLMCTFLVKTAYAENYYQEAEGHYNKGEYISAVIQLKNLLIEDPKNTQGRVLLGRAYTATEDYESAVKELLRAQQLGDKSNEVSLLLANIYLRQGQYQKVIDSLTANLLSDNDSRSEAYAILGHALIGTNQIVEAKEAFTNSIKYGSSPLAKVGQARVYAIEGDLPQALQLLDEVIAADAQQFDALLIKGQLLSTEEKHSEAIKFYDRALSIRKNNLLARLARAETFILLNQLGDAQKDLDVVLPEYSGLPSVNYLQARLFLAQEKYQLASEFAQNILKLDPGYRITYFILGAAHHGLNNFEQAKTHLEKYLLDQPIDIVGTRLLAATYLKLNDPDAVISLLEPQANYDSINDAGLLGMLGMAYLQVGNPDKASIFLTKALALNPELTEAKIQLATSQLMMGDARHALTQLENTPTQAGREKIKDLLLIAAYVKNNEADKALNLIQKRIDGTPDNPDYYHIKGLTYDLLNQNQQANAAYQWALKIDSNYVPTLLKLASSALNANKMSEAEKLLLRILETDSSNITAMMLLANISQDENNKDAELKWISRARDKNAKAIEPIRKLVDFYSQNNQPEKAVSEAVRYQTANPGSFHARALLANTLFKSGDYADAEFHLRKLISELPRDIYNRLLLAKTLIKLGNNKEALEQTNEVLSLNASYLPALVFKTEVLISEREFDKAKQISEIIRQSYPNINVADQLMADVLRAENKFAEAIPYYKKAFETQQTGNLARILHAVYMRDGNFERATQTLTRYLDQQPDDDLIRLKLAGTFQQRNLNKLAIEQYEMLLEKYTDNVSILNNLAWAHHVEGNQKALNYAERAFKLESKNPDISDTYGWILLQSGHNQRGLVVMQQAASLAPTNPEIRYHLSIALEKNGKKADAIKELKRLLRDYQGFASENLARALLSHLEG